MATDHDGRKRRNRLLGALSAADFALLAPHLREIEFDLGSLLQEAGEIVEHVYFPLSGMVSLLAVMADGESIETATVGREGVVGAMSGFGPRRSVPRAVVQTVPMAIARISTLRFRTALLQSVALRNQVVSYNEVLLAQVQQTAACNALHSIEARIARWLLQTRDRTERDELPLTQEFLGQMLGVRRTTVNQVARQLESAGLIRQQRGMVVIADRAGLEAVACECYAVLRDQLAAELPDILAANG